MEKNRVKSILFMAVVIMLIRYAIPVTAATWYVDADAPSNGDGKSWATAFRNIVTAINHAEPAWIQCFSPSDSIWIKSGTHNIRSEIVIDRSVSIYGGFPNSMANPGLLDRDWKKHPTIVNANGYSRCFRIYYYCRIDGLTMTNGSSSYGGAIYNDATPVDCTGTSLGYFSPIIRNCTFASNQASGRGGAIYMVGSDTLIENCTFSNNSAPKGGAIFHLSSSPQIQQCVFTGNAMTGPGESVLGGGAIAGYGRNETTGNWTSIINCLFVNNTSNSYGGAICYESVRSNIIFCTFTGNIAAVSAGAYKGLDDYPIITSNIFWGDSPNELEIQVTPSIPWDGIFLNDVQGGWTYGFYENLDVDPCFVGPADFHITADSACIDTGSNYWAPDRDLGNVLRPIDGDNDGDATADIGCYEYNPPTTGFNLYVTFQGALRPEVGWNIPINVKFFVPGSDVVADPTPLAEYDLMTSKSGNTAVAQISDLPVGTYDVTVYSDHTLMNIKRNMTVSETTNEVNMGTLLEGDANNDLSITLVDFASLATSWKTGRRNDNYNSMADFDRNDYINMLDFQLLADNWLKSSPVEIH